MKDSLDKPLGLDWCNTIKNLGIYFSCNQELVITQNFQEKLEKNSKNYKHLENERSLLVGESDNY